MTGFIAATMLLTISALLCLLRPWRRPAIDTSSAREVNAAVYRDQLAELDRDLASGALAAADHAQARAELRRRLLDDIGAGESGAYATPAMRTSSLLITLLVPLLAGSMYAWLGHPAALDESARLGPLSGGAEERVAALAARLAADPDDPGAWTVLARAYRAMGRVQDAQAAFERIGPALDRSPELLAEYAELLATMAHGNFEGRPRAMLERALELAPGTPLALALAANAAFKRADMAAAAAYWERLLKQLPPTSDDARWVADRLAQARGAAPRSAGSNQVATQP